MYALTKGSRIPTRTFLVLLVLLFGVTAHAGAALIQVYQESSPGAGDFDSNLLGSIGIFDQSGLTAAQVYNYDVGDNNSYNGTVVTPVLDTTQMFFVNTLEGLSLFVLHDKKIGDTDTGSNWAQLRYDFASLTTADFLVKDDPPADDPDDQYNGPSYHGVANTFVTVNRWSESAATDGVVIGDLGTEFPMFVSFKSGRGDYPIGINSWKAVGPGDETVNLALTVDRRVRLNVVPIPSAAWLLGFGLVGLVALRRKLTT
jgi:hypothetical protein